MNAYFEDMSGNEVKVGGKRNTRKNRKDSRKNTRKNRKGQMGGKKNTRKANTRKTNMRKEQMGGAIKATGTKAEVYHGTAKHTSGGLKKSDLMKTKRGRIVSKKKHAAGQKAIKKLRKMGYVAKKGTFKLFRKH